MIAEDFDDIVAEEVAALEAILMDDVTVLHAEPGYYASSRVRGVEVCVVPATAQKVAEQHVKCTLVATFPSSYPTVKPRVVIRNPRGIDESILSKIEQEMAAKCVECEGCPVIYELVELVRENLTANNTPSCPCTICLYHFTKSDHFTKTQCFHYFHKHCLGRYIANCEAAHKASLAEQQLTPWQLQQQPDLVLTCPVCREPISIQEPLSSLLSYPRPAAEATDVSWNPDAPEVVALRRSMRQLYLQQQRRGGIIDLEREKNKFLVSRENDEPRIEEVAPLDDPTPAPPVNNDPTLETLLNQEQNPSVSLQSCSPSVEAGHDGGTRSSEECNVQVAPEAGTDTSSSYSLTRTEPRETKEASVISSSGSDHDARVPADYDRDDHDRRVDRSCSTVRGGREGSSWEGRGGYRGGLRAHRAGYVGGAGRGGGYGSGSHGREDISYSASSYYGSSSSRGGGVEYAGRGRGRQWTAQRRQDAASDDPYQHSSQQRQQHYNQYYSQRGYAGSKPSNSRQRHYNNNPQQQQHYVQESHHHHHQQQPRYPPRQQYYTDKQYPNKYQQQRQQNRMYTGEEAGNKDSRSKLSANGRSAGYNPES